MADNKVRHDVCFGTNNLMVGISGKDDFDDFSTITIIVPG